MFFNKIQDVIMKCLKEHEVELMKDSLFGIVASFRTKKGNWSEREDWSK
jgi:hypothetical protein